MKPPRITSTILLAGLMALLPALAGCPRNSNDNDDGPTAPRPVSTSIDFGCRAVGDMIMNIVTVSNNGPTDIEVDQISFLGYDTNKVDITVDPNSMVMLPAMSSMDLDVSIHCLGQSHVRAIIAYVQNGLITEAATIFGECTDYTSPVTFNGTAMACTGGGMDGPVEFSLVCDPASLNILAEVQTFPAHCGCDTESISGALDPNDNFDMGAVVPGKTCEMTGTLTAPGMYNITTSAADFPCMIECTGMASP